MIFLYIYLSIALLFYLAYVLGTISYANKCQQCKLKGYEEYADFDRTAYILSETIELPIVVLALFWIIVVPYFYWYLIKHF